MPRPGLLQPCLPDPTLVPACSQLQSSVSTKAEKEEKKEEVQEEGGATYTDVQRF